jgi:Ca2+-binding RTX toxin-like protein
MPKNYFNLLLDLPLEPQNLSGIPQIAKTPLFGRSSRSLLFNGASEELGQIQNPLGKFRTIPRFNRRSIVATAGLSSRTVSFGRQSLGNILGSFSLQRGNGLGGSDNLFDYLFAGLGGRQNQIGSPATQPATPITVTPPPVIAISAPTPPPVIEVPVPTPPPVIEVPAPTSGGNLTSESGSVTLTPTPTSPPDITISTPTPIQLVSTSGGNITSESGSVTLTPTPTSPPDITISTPTPIQLVSTSGGNLTIGSGSVILTPTPPPPIEVPAPALPIARLAIEGTDGNDILTGTEGFDRINGKAGNDTISALAGNDEISGGAGNDIIDAGSGNDLIFGHGGNDTINGGDGEDLLAGFNPTAGFGIGEIDSLTGGSQRDIFVLGDVYRVYYDDGNATSTGESDYTLITDFNASEDVIQLKGSADLYRLDFYTNASGQIEAALIYDAGISARGEQIAIIQGVSPTLQLTDSAFIYGAVDYGDYGEITDYNVVYQDTFGSNSTSVNYTGGVINYNGGVIITGNSNSISISSMEIHDNSPPNIIDGTDGDDILIGTDGKDIISGLGGNDSISALAGNDQIFGGEGDDTIDGGDGWDTIEGGSGNDVLNGGAGADSLTGGTGNDSYYVDTIGDTITELSGEGSDTVYSTIDYTLGANLENLVLQGTAINGTGNELDNSITGNGADNILNGGAGADFLTGGTGNDAYYVDTIGDTITELFGEGSDTVYSTIDYTLGANLENLVLQGTAISGTGNELNNSITGNSADNILNGSAGADFLTGGTGNDAYYVDTIGDNITELFGEGSDTVYSSSDYTLGANLENLVLQGTAINGTGNELNNSITGNGADNILNGGEGNDTINGGAENDTINGNEGNDTLAGDDGNDVINGGTDNDTLAGGIGNDTLTGAAGNDTLSGDEGDDMLTGGAGNDILDGGAGNDTLLGVDAQSGFGAFELDTLTGGAGGDTFLLGDASRPYYDDGNPISTGEGNYALLKDFNASEDAIQLHGSANLYLLDFFTTGSGTLSAALIYDSGITAREELIGIIEGVSADLTLNSPAFNFV